MWFQSVSQSLSLFSFRSDCIELDFKEISYLVILKDKYQDYKSALKKVNIESLHDRREFICLKAKKALRLEQFKKLFPVQKNLHGMEKRNGKKFKENRAKTEWYKKSSIPSMQRLLNNHEKKLNGILKSLDPCTNDNWQMALSSRKFNL